MTSPHSVSRKSNQRGQTNRRSFGLVTLAMTLLLPVALISMLAAGPTVARLQPEASPIGDQAVATPVGTPGNESTADVRCTEVFGTGDEGDACVAFVHAVPTLEPVDFTLEGGDEAAASDVAFGNFVDFIAVSTNDVTVEISDTASPDLLITESSLELQPDRAYALVLEQAYNQDAPTVTAVPIDLAPLGPEASRLVFHHSVSDADELSVLGLAPPFDARIAPGATTDPITVDAGASSIDVVPGNERDDVLATLTVQLEPGISYLVIIGGTTSDTPLAVIYAAAPVALGG